MHESKHFKKTQEEPLKGGTDVAKDNLDSARVERSTAANDGKDSSKTAADVLRLPAPAVTDMDRADQFVLKEIDRFTKLMPGEVDPRSIQPLETQDEVDTRFASINWKAYDQGRKLMQERTDGQKQHLSEFDRNMLDLLEQQLLLKNIGAVNLLGDGLARNSGKYKDLLQTFNKDLQTIGQKCQLKDGRFSVE
jgi:hypothetical protein